MKTREEIEKFLGEAAEEITLGQVSAKDVGPETQLLVDLALDSLDYATLMLMCEHWLGGRVDESSVDWRGVATVRQLSEILYRSQSAANEL